MSLFNTFKGLISCPGCSSESRREIQFRYGHVWQYDYVLGSRINWGPAAVGDPRLARVVVDGWIDECEQCALDGRVALYIRDNTIWGVGPVAWEPCLPDQGWIEDGSESGSSSEGPVDSR